MNTRVGIVTDSTADIPDDLRVSHRIEVVPAIITLDGETYKDGLDISREEFYDRLPALKSPPTTGAPSLRIFEETYERMLQSGIEKLLSIHLPSSLSGMLDVATQAGKAFGDRVRTFDSGQVSLGTGFQVLEAAEAALAELPFESVLETAQQAKERVRLIAMIDRLEFLQRSGRISWVSAGIANVLNIKILLEIKDGVIERLGQVRTRGKAKAQLHEVAETWGLFKRLAIAHSASGKDAEEFAEGLSHLCPDPPLIIDVTTTIGAHIGPGALGVIALKQSP